MARYREAGPSLSSNAGGKSLPGRRFAVFDCYFGLMLGSPPGLPGGGITGMTPPGGAG
jgi:hypothetical protein